ncbi:MAG TPA: hypothetical protein VFI90_20555 [Rubrobacter sp.]|nr:hypothetical protein [Rubrobacter sp.]
MSAARIAWSIWTLSLVVLVSGGVLGLLNASTPTPGPGNGPVFGFGFLLLAIAFATVGALIASRQPGNVIGWLFSALGLFLPLSSAGEEYALYVLKTRPDSLPWGEVVAWAAGWFGGPILFVLVAFVFLLFPNGRLLSRRWRPALWANLVAVALLLAWYFKPGQVNSLTLVKVSNPFGIASAGAFLEPLGSIGFLLILAAAVAGAVSLLLRLRRAVGDERQQLKWFLFAGAIFCSVFVAGPVLWSLPPSSGTDWIWPALFLAGTSTIPAATGFAMLKYRLYDIDVIINRTLVYAALTASCVLVYFGTVVVLQYVFRVLTGSESQLAVVASTLAIAALFNPLRRRIQSFIDRRFYRRKYDARKTLEEFGSRLREETDLDALKDHLIGVVRETMQPAHTSLWMRAQENRREVRT